jgi:predicted transcriptional regulator
MSDQNTSGSGAWVQREKDLAERFLVAFNAIEKHLRGELNEDKHIPFGRLVRQYERRHRVWPDADQLRIFAELRNLIIHEKDKPYEYISIPTEMTVDQIERIHDRLLRPERVVPKYQKKVTTVSFSDSLADVLERIDQHDFSQFPVYGDGEFRGLLTENGITRWLAHHRDTQDTLLELKDTPVQDVLGEQEHPHNYQFVRKDMLLDDLKCLFAERPLLEAALITADGSAEQKLLGIATRGDILKLLS